MGKPHVHAEFIKAKADGYEIEERGLGIHGIWMQMPAHDWKFAEQCQYRIKPEPPAKVYPVTGMSDQEIMTALCEGVPRGFPMHQVREARYVANAALRHAIDSGQLVEPVDGLTTWARELHLKMSEALVKELKKARRTLELAGYTDNGGELWKPPLGKSPDDRAARDLAIAEAVMTAFLHSRFTITGNDGIDLPAIIATVKE